MNKLYEEIVFHNDMVPELNEDNLNAMSEALNAIDDRVIEGYASAILVGRVLDDAKGYADAAETSATNAAQSVTDAAEQVTLAEEQVILAAEQVELAKGYAEEALKGSGGNNLNYSENRLQLKRDDAVLSEVEINAGSNVDNQTIFKNEGGFRVVEFIKNSADDIFLDKAQINKYVKSGVIIKFASSTTISFIAYDLNGELVNVQLNPPVSEYEFTCDSDAIKFMAVRTNGNLTLKVNDSSIEANTISALASGGSAEIDGIVIREITEAEYLANQEEYDAMDIEWNITDAETINLPTIDVTKADYLANQEYFDNLPNIINIIDEMPLDAYDVPYKNTTVGGQLDTMVEYSTEERVVGKWIDGKPLYERFVTNGSTSANTIVRVKLNAPIEMGLIVWGAITVDNGKAIYPMATPPISNVTTTAMTSWITTNSHTSQPNTLSYASTMATNSMVARIRYTKTTDEVEEG